MSSPRSARSARKAREKSGAGAARHETPARDWLGAGAAVPALLAVLVFLFYAAPLTSSIASIQWDAADVHYSCQKYWSDNLREGKLPFWTPYVYSGMPFLADPQVGAWYPLNWPFFLAGITPRSIEWELALHALLACLGTYLLARDLVANRGAALLAAIGYGFSGFFASHSSHVGMFQGASLFPWLLWSFGRALERDWRLYGAAASLAGAGIVLAGHFQTALYCFFGLALFAAATIALDPNTRARGSALLAGVAAASALLAAVEVLPGLELTWHSIRAGADFGKQTNSSLPPGALLTLLLPDFYGAVSGSYSGPGDITQFYFYQGPLLPVLAAAGFRRGRLRWIALALLVPAVWYALGPPGGLYLAIAWLPGFRSVRAPVHIWFVAALALSLAAAAGAAWADARWRAKWLIPAMLAIVFADLWYWNMSRNALAYARAPYDELYGTAADNFERASAPIRQNPLHRIWFEHDSNTFGPMNWALNSRTETSYGYNPLELQAYADYVAAARSNPRLIDGLAATHKIDGASGTIVPNPSALPRISVPRAVTVVRTGVEAKAALASLDPAERAIVVSPGPAAAQAPGARADIVGYEGDRYGIRYSAASPVLLRVAVPYFPGWTATVEGRPVPVAAVDYALTGIFVPAGSHEVNFAYRPTWFAAGAGVSALAAVAGLAIAVWGRRSRRKTAGGSAV